MKRYVIIIILFSLFSIFSVSAQYHTNNRRAIKHFQSAVESFDKFDNASAMESLDKALRADKNFMEAYMMRAQILKDQGENELAINDFEKALSIDPDAYPQGYMVLASVQYSIGRYKDAKSNVLKFKNLGEYGQMDPEVVENFLEKLNFAIHAIENPVPFDPINLGNSVNSDRHEYWPSLSLDENTLIFTVLDPVDPSKPPVFGNRQEDFYYSVKDSVGNWTKRRNAGRPLNTSDNEGAQSLSADGKTLYFTACNRQNGFGMCDIFISVRKDNFWSKPFNIGPVINSKYSDKHPSISADGRSLYFASDRPGGKGDLDIWVSEKKLNGGWTTPVNLGDSINTPGVEQSPFIHPDNQSLYFSSTGHQNMGKGDIFLSKRNEMGKWGKPVNLGYPINTWNDETGLIVNTAGDTAYYASDRLEERGMDIYAFALHNEVRPVQVSYMKGRVYDVNTRRPLEAKFQLIDLATGDTVVESLSRKPKGDFLIPLPVNRDYALNVRYPGYLFYSDNFSFHGIHEKLDPFLKNIPMKPVRKGESVVLKNIFFEFDHWELKKESFVELNKVAEFMKNNPGLKVEIAGHTDNVGSDEYNKDLSLKRAKAVTQYLIDHGISEERLLAKGYGEERPVSSNETESGRAENRRTEFIIKEINN